jgi:hypothetical protein
MVLSTLGRSIKFFVLQCNQSSPPRLDCHVYLNSKYLSSPRRICLIVVCLHSTLYLMIHALIVVKFDWHMSPLTFALTLKIPVPDTRWYTLSFSNLMSYIFLVISVLDDKIHPVTFVLKWCLNILPTPSSCLGYVSPCYVIHPYFSCVCMQCNIDLDDKYTLSPSYSNDVLISIWLHPAASVRIPLLRHTPPF